MEILVRKWKGAWVASVRGDRRKPRPMGSGTSWQGAVRALVKVDVSPAPAKGRCPRCGVERGGPRHCPEPPDGLQHGPQGCCVHSDCGSDRCCEHGISKS